DALQHYNEARLFHGPPLQGLRRLLEQSPLHAVLQCRLADANVADRAYHGRLHSPVLADVMLQGAAGLCKVLVDEGALPLGFGRVEWFAPLPDDEPFILVMDDLRQRDVTITVTVTALSPDGRVLQRFADVVLVSTSGMNELYREAVRYWLPADEHQE